MLVNSTRSTQSKQPKKPSAEWSGRMEPRKGLGGDRREERKGEGERKKEGRKRKNEGGRRGEKKKNGRSRGDREGEHDGQREIGGVEGHLRQTEPELVRVQFDLLHALRAGVLALLARAHGLRGENLVSIEPVHCVNAQWHA